MYEQYEKKMQWIRGQLRKFRFVLAGLVILAALLFLFLKGVGVIYSGISVKSSYRYGEAVNPTFSSSVHKKEFLYADGKGEENWRTETPKDIGTYKVKGRTVSFLHIIRNTGEAKFSIVPKKLRVIGEDVECSEEPAKMEVTPDMIRFEGLEYGDTVLRFDIVRKERSKTEVQFYPDNIVIIHADGTDATDCYETDIERGKIQDSRIPITVRTGSKTVTYSGNPSERVSCEEFEIVSGKLRSGDTVQILDYPAIQYITPYGEEIPNRISEDKVKVVDADGNDVTSNYRITLQFGKLALYPRSIAITSGSAKKEYDGTPLTSDSYTLEGELAPGDELRMYISGTITDPGVEMNNFAFEIVSKTHGDVVKCYDIRSTLGQLVVVAPAEKIHGSDEDVYNMSSAGFGEGDKATILFRFRGTMDRTYYFREHTYGEYTGRGWKSSEAEKNMLAQSYLETGRVLASHNGVQDCVEIEDKILDTTVYPYYVFPSGETDGSKSGDYDNSCLCYVPKGNVLPKGEADEISSAVREDAYRNYLAVPENVEVFLRYYGQDAGISKSDPDLVEKIASCIQHSAKYNLNFRQFPEDSDMVIYFLLDAKEGICQHFAAAATMMYRTYGIPARYTVGYMETGKAHEWVDMNASRGHAWVEIYLDDVGWVPVEVTGGSGGRGSVGGGDGEGQGTERADLVIEFSRLEKEYDGNPVWYDPTYCIAEGSLMEGDSLECTLEQEYAYTDVGTYTLYPNVRIKDEAGFDVTDEYRMSVIEPEIKIEKRHIEITTYGNRGEETPGGISDPRWYISKGSLANGDRVVIFLTEIQEKVGVKVNAPFVLTILDRNGENVTSRYSINLVSGVLTVE